MMMVRLELADSVEGLRDECVQQTSGGAGTGWRTTGTLSGAARRQRTRAKEAGRATPGTVGAAAALYSTRRPSLLASRGGCGAKDGARSILCLAPELCVADSSRAPAAAGTLIQSLTSSSLVYRRRAQRCGRNKACSPTVSKDSRTSSVCPLSFLPLHSSPAMNVRIRELFCVYNLPLLPSNPPQKLQLSGIGQPSKPSTPIFLASGDQWVCIMELLTTDDNGNREATERIIRYVEM